MPPKDTSQTPPRPPEGLLRVQRQFAAHIRDPDNNEPVAGIEERRLVIYRRLFFNNVSNLMARNFPVLRKLHEDDDWARLIRRFMCEHHAETPLFPQIGQELVRFLERLQEADELDLPFLAELAHWEFVETSVRLDQADPLQVEPTPGADPASGRPVLNPTVRLGMYRWPVHQLGPRYQPTAPLEKPVILLAYRKRDDKVAFKAINPLTAQLINFLQEHPDSTGLEQLERIAVQLPDVNAGTLKQKGLEMLSGLLHSEVILAIDSR